MGTLKPLHTKPLWVFIRYAMLVLVISIPAYVFLINAIWIHELDEHNQLVLENTRKALIESQPTSEEMTNWNRMLGALNPGVRVIPYGGDLKSDSHYSVSRELFISGSKEEEKFRGLLSYMELEKSRYQPSVETNMEDTHETFLAVTVVTSVFFALLILGMIWLSKRVYSRTFQPFYETLSALRSFDITQNEPIALTTSDIQEFEELNESVQDLMKRNLKSFQQQRTFVENASHELQTPIAILRSKIDLLSQQQFEPTIQEMVTALESPMSRLTRINKNLLLLSRLENAQFREREGVNAADVITDTLELFEDFLQNDSMKVSFTNNRTDLLRCNRFLYETLIQNLVSNAIRHSEKGSDLFIEISNDYLMVMNPGKVELRREYLFTRFASSSNENVSSGLGLAIVKEVVVQHGWTVDYAFNHGLHCFEVQFS